MLTALVTVVVSLLPGAILAFAVPAGVHRWVTLAASPALTLGLTSAGMAWLGLVHLPNSAQAVFIFEVLLALLAVAATHLWRRRLATAADDDPPVDDPPVDVADVVAEDRPAWALAARGWRGRLRRVPILADVVAVGIPAVIAVGFGWHLLGPLAYPPGWDAMNHGILTRNIVNAGSTSINSACVTGSTHGVVACTFYPLATNIDWAQGAVLSGGHISTAMLVWSEAVGPLALVLAIYAAVRVFGARPAVAGSAAVASVFVSPVWAALLTGRPTEAFGPALAVSAAVLALLALRGKHPIRMGVLTGLAVGGVVMTHSYDMLFGAVLGIAFVAVRLRGLRFRTLGYGLAATVVGLAVALAPLGSAISGASAERTAHNPAFVGHVKHALVFWITDTQRYVVLGYPGPTGSEPHHSPAVQAGVVIVVVCLLASPLCLVFNRLRWARPWLATWVVWMAISVWTGTSTSALAAKISGLWYGIRERERVMIAPMYGVLVVAGACGIGLALGWVATALARRNWRVRPAVVFASITAVLAVGAVIGDAAVPSGTRGLLQRRLVADAPRGGSYPAVFHWLAQHTPKGDVVAYDRHRDFITWSFVNDNVPLLFGMSAVKASGVANTQERDATWNWLVDNPTGVASSGCLVRKFRVAYVVIGREHVPMSGKSQYSRKRVAASPNLRLIRVTGPLKIYAVTPAGRACGSAS